MGQLNQYSSIKKAYFHLCKDLFLKTETDPLSCSGPVHAELVTADKPSTAPDPGDMEARDAETATSVGNDARNNELATSESNKSGYIQEKKDEPCTSDETRCNNAEVTDTTISVTSYNTDKKNPSRIKVETSFAHEQLDEIGTTTESRDAIEQAIEIAHTTNNDTTNSGSLTRSESQTRYDIEEEDLTVPKVGMENTVLEERETALTLKNNPKNIEYSVKAPSDIKNEFGQKDEPGTYHDPKNNETVDDETVLNVENYTANSEYIIRGANEKKLEPGATVDSGNILAYDKETKCNVGETENGISFSIDIANSEFSAILKKESQNVHEKKDLIGNIAIANALNGSEKETTHTASNDTKHSEYPAISENPSNNLHQAKDSTVPPLDSEGIKAEDMETVLIVKSGTLNQESKKNLDSVEKKRPGTYDNNKYTNTEETEVKICVRNEGFNSECSTRSELKKSYVHEDKGKICVKTDPGDTPQNVFEGNQMTENTIDTAGEGSCLNVVKDEQININVKHEPSDTTTQVMEADKSTNSLKIDQNKGYPIIQQSIAENADFSQTKIPERKYTQDLKTKSLQEMPIIFRKDDTIGKKVSFNKKIGVRTFDSSRPYNEEEEPNEIPDTDILAKKDKPTYISFTRSEEYIKSDVTNKRVQSNKKEPIQIDIKESTDSKISKFKSLFSKAKEDKTADKLWSKLSFSKSASSNTNTKSEEEKRLEAEAKELNDLMRQTDLINDEDKKEELVAFQKTERKMILLKEEDLKEPCIKSEEGIQFT